MSKARFPTERQEARRKYRGHKAEAKKRNIAYADGIKGLLETWRKSEQR